MQCSSDLRHCDDTLGRGQRRWRRWRRRRGSCGGCSFTQCRDGYCSWHLNSGGAYLAATHDDKNDPPHEKEGPRHRLLFKRIVLGVVIVVGLAQPFLVFLPPFILLLFIPHWVPSDMDADHLHCHHLLDAGIASSVPLLYPVDPEAPGTVVK